MTFLEYNFEYIYFRELINFTQFLRNLTKSIQLITI
jgi:hypothetical protein